MPRRLSLLAWLFALTLLALSMTQARPQAASIPPQTVASDGGVETTHCFGTRFSSSCVSVFREGRDSLHVIAVPQPATEQERAAAEARDRRWVARCNPAIRQDRYGMLRYVYSAPGCEYGRLD